MFLEYPVVRLKNKLTVANFSSPHEFHFDDGSLLDGCDVERSNWLSLENIEDRKFNGKFFELKREYIITDRIVQELERMERYDDSLDIILVPSIVRKLCNEEYGHIQIHKIFSCKSSSRFDKMISSTEFICGDQL